MNEIHLNCHLLYFSSIIMSFGQCALRWLINSVGTIYHSHQKMSTRIHPKNVHENSPKVKNIHENSPKVSTRIHFQKMSNRIRPFKKKCPREFIVLEKSLLVLNETCQCSQLYSNMSLSDDFMYNTGHCALKHHAGNTEQIYFQNSFPRSVWPRDNFPFKIVAPVPFSVVL